MSTQPLISASRFYQRWLAPPPSALPRSELAHRWTSSTGRRAGRGASAGTPPLPPERAMRRLRNLLVCGLIRRDLEGQANLNEVVTAMTRFADFAIARMWTPSWPRWWPHTACRSARFGRGTA
jgi:glutamate-ammonia-ligase adenylyltransferase